MFALMVIYGKATAKFHLHLEQSATTRHFSTISIQAFKNKYLKITD